MSTKIRLLSGEEIVVSDEVYERQVLFVNRAHNRREYIMGQNGEIVKVDNIGVFYPPATPQSDDAPMYVEPMENTPIEPENEGSEGMKVDVDASVKVETSDDKVPAPKTAPSELTGDEIKEVIEKMGMSQTAFATSIGYGSATLRIAIKEGKMTDDFVAAFKKKYQSVLDEIRI